MREIRSHDQELVREELSMEKYTAVMLDSMRHLRRWLESMLPDTADRRGAA